MLYIILFTQTQGHVDSSFKGKIKFNLRLIVKYAWNSWLLLLTFPSGFDSQVWPMLREQKVISAVMVSQVPLCHLFKVHLSATIADFIYKIHCAPANIANSKEQGAGYTEFHSALEQSAQFWGVKLCNLTKGTLLASFTVEQGAM